MKYVFVILGLIILSLYATVDHQIKKIHILQIQTTALKSELSQQYLSINKLEDYRKSLKPTRILIYSFPMVEEEFDNITSFWALQNDPLRRKNTGGTNTRFHPAIDMSGIKGAQVLAVASGIVEIKYYEKGWHYVAGAWREYSGHEYFNGYVAIKHDDGMTSHYVHVAEILVHEGQRVSTGQQIAQISEQNWEFSTGPHLDFRLQNKNGEYVNPLLYIGWEK